MCQDTSGAITR